MLLAVPGVEVADYAYLAGGRRPDCKANSFYSFVSDRMSAKFLVNALVPPFTKKMQIDFAESW